MIWSSAITATILLVIYLIFTSGGISLSIAHGFAPHGTSLSVGLQVHCGKCGCTLIEFMLFCFKFELSFKSRECLAADLAKEKEVKE